MKKFIFLTQKNKVYHFFAHPCCSLMRIDKLLIIVFFSLFSINVSAQLVGDATVKANFGVEADVYANRLQFPNADVPVVPLPNAAGTDDWFVNQTLYPGSGKGVIDQTNAAAITALIQGTSKNNYAFERRQSITTPTFPFPYPIVDGYLWLDSVYGRDNNSAQGASDLSIFGGTGDKNSDNPNTWALSTGSIPQKDDIIDVYAHLRGIGPKAPSDIDPRPFTELWAFAGGSLRETNGSKHIDFEFFRTLIDYVPGDIVFGNTGNDGGRTAWDFDATGNILVPGTLIISIDYEGGGTKPDVRIRVWMNQADLANFNSLANRPFNIDASTFEQGLNSGAFGYVRIEALNNAVPNLFGRVNKEAITLAAPWGTIEGENASFETSYKELQFVEIGINLTAFGLDRRGEEDPCSNILGSLLVKTRSSAGGNSDSFTSELKDFAGPYIFGNSTDPSVDLTGGGEINCDNPTLTLTATLTNPMTPSSSVNYSFYGPDNDNDPSNGFGPLLQGPSADNTLDLNSFNQPGTYTVVVDALAFPGCSKFDRVDVTVVNCDPVDVAGPGNSSTSQCDYADQAAVDAAFAAWLAQFQTLNDGCSAVAQFSGDPRVAPRLCDGGVVNVTYSIADNCSRDSVSASFTLNGEADVDVAGPGNSSTSQCDYADQAAVDAAFAAWLAQFQTLNDGCNAVAQFSGDPRVAPRLCDGGVVNVTYSIADNCSRDSVSASFTLNGEADVDVAGPGNSSTSQCDYADQAAVDAAFAAWLAQFQTLNDGCSAVAQFSGDPRVAPRLCDGGVVNVTYSIADNCSQDSVSASFTLNGEADVDVAGPGNSSTSQCDYADQAAVDAAFAAWLAQFQTLNDGCNAVAQFSGDPRVAPRLCDGGVVNVTYSIADNCSRDSVSASFTLNGEADVDVAGPGNSSTSQCDYADQAAVDAAFAAWLAQFQTLNDGCSAVAQFSGDPRVAPRLCDGGVVNVTYSIADNCSQDSVSASFTLNGEADVDVAGPGNSSTSQCDYADQAAVDAAFAAWLAQFQTLNDGCSAVAQFSGDPRVAPRLCDGGVVNVTYSIADNCSRDSVSASFTLNGEADVDVAGPGNSSTSQCDYADQAAVDAAFAAWLAQFQTLNDGCNAVAQFSGDPRVAPRLCDGGVVNVTYSIADNCSRDSVSASFTLNGEADVDVAGPGNSSTSQCDYADQAAVDAAFAAWLAQFQTLNDGCSAVAQFSGDPRVAPRLCDGGVVNVTYSIADNCSRDSVSASFTLNGEADVDVAGPGNSSTSQCDYADQAAVDAAFAAWLAQFQTLNDGCNAVAQFSGDPRVAPRLCDGGVVNVTYSIADNCSRDSVSASFTLNGEADVDVAGPGNSSTSQCDYADQAAVDAAFAAWLAQFQTLNDGCSAVAQFSGDPRVAPRLCDGGVVNVTYSIADNCSRDSVSASFTLNGEADVDVAGPGNSSTSQCDYADQAAVDAAFAAWLAQFQTLNDGCGTVAEFSGDPRVAPRLCDGGTVNVTYRITDNCSRDSVSASFILNAAEELSITCPPDVDLTCSQDPKTEFDAWIATFGFTGGCSPIATDLSSYTLPKPGQSVTITYEVSDNCDTESCTVTFKVPECSEVHCTYTQGYYGELNGSACTPDGQPTYDHQIMINAINQAGGAFDFGSTGTGNYFTLKASDVYGNSDPTQNNVFVMLPGGGNPRALVGFATYDQYSTWSDDDPLRASGSNKGRINNNLLSQTMTMFFNLSLDSGLGDVVLEKKFATADVACGSEIPDPRTYTEFAISNTVINYLNANYAGGATVANLFILANKALGGENIGSLTHSDINGAVDAINRGYDGCRIKVRLNTSSLTLTTSVVSPIVDEPVFTAYPIPFKDILNIKYDFDYTSDVKIQIFDTKGSLLMTESDTDAYPNKEISIRPSFNRGDGQLFFVKLITNRGVSIKKVISQK